MAGDTEQKILDAALKVFSENGYKGATIKVIAQKAGFSELTLFNKFNNKRNLYEMVMLQNTEKVKKEFISVLSEEDFENPEEYLRSIIRDIAKTMDNNVEFVQLAQSETSSGYSSLVKEFHLEFAKHLEKNIHNTKINYLSFAFSITANMYLRSVNIKIIEFPMDPEIVLNGFIDNCILLIQA